MMQTKVQSFIEATVNVFLGWIVAFTIQLIVFPLYGIHMPMSSNIQISVIFTVAAIVRGYYVRRYFNWRLHAWLQRINK